MEKFGPALDIESPGVGGVDGCGGIVGGKGGEVGAVVVSIIVRVCRSIIVSGADMYSLAERYSE